MEQKSEQKKVILSGVQPTGILSLGQMIGAINNWVELQQEFECYYCVVDLHALTIDIKPADLRKHTLDMAATFLAAGINPESSAVFVQSHVHEHAELAWVLSCITGMGEAGRMTQFKEKSSLHTENVNVGLFTYPILMAADILLYNADVVPVGEDQKQHLELTRNIADKFNHRYSPTFTVPEPYIAKQGARIKSLQDPTKKMSKSDPNNGATIFLTDSNEQIANKIKRAVTDSGTTIEYNEDARPGVSNLIDIYAAATGLSREAIVEHFAGKGYAEFKQTVADATVEYIRPLRERFVEIRSDVSALDAVLQTGAEKARVRARKTLRKVYKKIGLWQGE